MRKVFKIDVDCALCAENICSALNKCPEVNNANINFIAEKLVVDYTDSLTEEEIYKLVLKTGKKVDADFRIVR